MIIRLIAMALLLAGCCPPPEEAPTPEKEKAPEQVEQPEEKNYVYLYARLHENQSADTARDQYLEKLQQALADREATIKIEEIAGIEGVVEYIGVDFKIEAQQSETESLDELLMDTFRMSGAPYATDIYVYEP